MTFSPEKRGPGSVRSRGAWTTAAFLLGALAYLPAGVVFALEIAKTDPECATSFAYEPLFYPWIQRTYVLQEGLCGTENPQLVTIHGDRIEGPDFDCTPSAILPGAGTGMAAFDVVCHEIGQRVAGKLILDLGNAADHFKLLLPGSNDWLSLYTCDNPHLLKTPG